MTRKQSIINNNHDQIETCLDFVQRKNATGDLKQKKLSEIYQTDREAAVDIMLSVSTSDRQRYDIYEYMSDS